VDFVDNRLDAATGTILVRASLDNSSRTFVPGMFARVQMPGSSTFSAMLIDDKAVLTDQDRKYVYVVEDGIAQRRDVTAWVGPWTGCEWWTADLRGRPGCGERCPADFAKFFIDRPIFAAVLSIMIFARGIIAIPLLPVSEYPDVVPPSVQVRAVYPRRQPDEIAETVATPLEEAINGVENMMYMKSVAGSDGVLALTVTFEPGTDPDQAQVQVQNRVNQALPRCPRTVRRQGVTTQKQSPDLTMVVHLLSPDGKLRHRSTCATTPPCTSRTSWRACPGVGQAICSAPATTPCASGSTRTRPPRAT
jgi:hypothetical protein